MLSKGLFVFGLVFATAQAASIERVKIENPTAVSFRNDIDINNINSEQLLNILEILNNIDIENFMVDQLNIDEEKIKVIISLVLNILNVDNADEILCVLDIVMEYDREETLSNLRILIHQGPDLLRLQVERRQKLAECEAIGGENPSATEQLQKRRCIAQVEVLLGTQITIVTFRVRSALNYFRTVAQNLNTCTNLVPAQL